MPDITYATKLWQGDLEALARHPNADLVIANNLRAKIIDIGETDDPFFTPELEAVIRCKTKYILWYSADVIPPETDWVKDALPLLEKYPIVTCLWHLNAGPKDDGSYPDIRTDWGWETYRFSDQCYLSTAEFMRSIDYEVDHPIKEEYPKHGGNSFERRVAQYLASQGKPMAVITNHLYQHIPGEAK